MANDQADTGVNRIISNANKTRIINEDMPNLMDSFHHPDSVKSGST
jgi:hypothetical protein